MWNLRTARREAASDHQNLMKSELRRCPQTANNRAKIDEVLGETTAAVRGRSCLFGAATPSRQHIGKKQLDGTMRGQQRSSFDCRGISKSLRPHRSLGRSTTDTSHSTQHPHDQEPEELRGVIGRTVVPSAYNPSLEQDGPYRRGVLPPRRVELRCLPPRPVVRVELGV